MNGKEDNMHKGAPSSSFIKAQNLRKTMTQPEIIIWNELKANKFQGYKFRRQHPIQLYIADFYCHQLKLIIEIDGGYHSGKEQVQLDKERTVALEEMNLHVIRFSNDDVINDVNKVLEKISHWISQNPSL